MGYAHYTLPDGREAGYGVEAECDKEDCSKQIDRGHGYLCGEQPEGWRSEEDWGCGNYYCGEHLNDHACKNDMCGAYPFGDGDICERLDRHNGPHKDRDGTEFTKTEDDDE